MKNAEFTAMNKGQETSGNSWFAAAKQTLLARQKKRQFKQKRKAQREEQNEQFSKMVNYNR